MLRFSVALFFAAIYEAAAQSPQVPHKMDFAGLTLVIRDDARKEIQKDVDALTASPRHFNIKAERARTYFPVIEKVFAEEQVPDDFKFLVLQESALIADAVSVSNAVGFWQFKDFTAVEMGLRVDKEVDERMNIVSSTRAAARYLKKNNTFFDNWVYALQAYQMGAGGVMRSVKDTQNGTRHMEITSKTYWYVKKFLAYKVAFEGSTQGPAMQSVIVFENKNAKPLSALSQEVAVDEQQLLEFNKWIRSGKIPGDRMYAVLIPVANPVGPLASSENRVKKITPTENTTAVSAPVFPAARSVQGKINGVSTILAKQGDNASTLAERGGVDLARFLKWNDISISDPILPGQYYFLARKRVRASEAYHKISAGENLWLISQHYGVQLRRLKKYNHLENAIPPVGTMLWLASTKPKEKKVLAPVSDPVVLTQHETFNWAVTTAPSEEEQAETSAPVTIRPPEPVKDPDSVLRVETPVVEASTPEVAPTESVTTEVQDAVVRIPDSKIHVVQPRETLYAIARMYGLTVMNLVEWNDLDLQSGIRPGQALRLEEKPTPAAEIAEARGNREIVHEVKSSDTLYSIARQYSVTIKELMEWNGKKDFSLSIGEKLKIVRGQ